MPAAQGTICRIQSPRAELSGSIQGWCYKGECVPEGYRPIPVDGQWLVQSSSAYTNVFKGQLASLV